MHWNWNFTPKTESKTKCTPLQSIRSESERGDLVAVRGSEIDFACRKKSAIGLSTSFLRVRSWSRWVRMWILEIGDNHFSNSIPALEEVVQDKMSVWIEKETVALILLKTSLLVCFHKKKAGLFEPSWSFATGWDGDTDTNPLKSWISRMSSNWEVKCWRKWVRKKQNLK